MEPCPFPLSLYFFPTSAPLRFPFLFPLLWRIGSVQTSAHQRLIIWSDQDVLYDYNADLDGIGNRSFIL